MGEDNIDQGRRDFLTAKVPEAAMAALAVALFGPEVLAAAVSKEDAERAAGVMVDALKRNATVVNCAKRLTTVGQKGEATFARGDVRNIVEGLKKAGQMTPRQCAIFEDSVKEIKVLITKTGANTADLSISFIPTEATRRTHTLSSSMTY